MELAVKFGLTIKNMAKLVNPPKETQAELVAWDIDEVQTFLEVAKDSHLYMLYLIAINTV
ncbi:hypothetical protein [Bacillus subtilis]|uniref:hypothetical protein n=1 Tax=Bacillus subtilis TaxID=1423 RepID=UPI003F84F075